MNPLVQEGLLRAGSAAANWLGSSGRRREWDKASGVLQGDMGSVRNRIGQDVFNPGAVGAFARRGIYGDVNTQANRLSRDFGFDAPAARTALWGRANEALAGTYGGAYMQNRLAMSERDMQALRMLISGNLGYMQQI